MMEDFCSLSVCSRDRDEEQEGDIFVSLVFCWSKSALRCRDAVRGGSVRNKAWASIVADVFET